MSRTPAETLWRSHLNSAFPINARGREVAGVDLVLLDSLSAGCISSLLQNPNDGAKSWLLADLLDQLRSVLPHLEGDSRSYFDQLAAVAEAVLVCARVDTR